MWTEHDNALTCTFRFAFMTEVAAVAEKLDHHPWWANEYSTVEFRLRTHDAGNTVTRRDHRLAEAISKIAEQHGAVR
jgi:4a-hydroxytetrahydrobiopterin dehydratase